MAATTPAGLRLLRAAVIALAFVGFSSAVARALGVGLSIRLPASARPALSPLDESSFRTLGAALDVKPDDPLYVDAQVQHRRLVGKFNQHPAATLWHVGSGALLMLLAPLQFSRSFRDRHLRWHRRIVRTLLILAIPTALSGLYFGLAMPFAGLAEASAVALFGSLFLITVVRGYVAIRKGNVTEHSEWMTRMFGIALGAAIQRMIATAIVATTLQGPERWFALSVWLGFAAGAMSAEVLIRLRREPAAVWLAP